MPITSWGLILGAVLLGAAAQLLLKAGTNAVGPFPFTADNLLPAGWRLVTQPAILGGILSYGASLVLWIMALSRVEVSVAYPMVSIGYLITAVAAWYLLGEQVTPLRLLGIGIIILGVILVARS